MSLAGAASIVALADQCVKCGLCLPHCPTYRVARTEAESPRGRIAFAHALASGRIEPAPALVQHLDQCLACLHCERVCPSQVRYGELIVATRALMRSAAPHGHGERSLGFLLARPRWLAAALRTANWPPLRRLARSRLVQTLLRPFGLERLARELPRLPRAPTVAARTVATPRGRVGLFIGCVAAAVDRDVHAGAARLLTALGYTPVVPKAQGCCGALALHAGDVAGAEALGTKLRAAFADADLDSVLVSASGCFGTLRDHVFARGAVKVREIHEFIAGDPRVDALRFRPCAARAVLHTPCTQTNVAHGGEAIRRLLDRIPQLQMTALPDQPGCCGAAGDYFLRHAAIAEALRAEKLQQVQELQPELLITSNVGCRIFLDNGLHQRGAATAVIHPIALLARQLEN